MSNLSHTTKVQVRKALAALRKTDEFANADDPMTDAMGAGEFVAQAYQDSVRRTVRKAGFSSREDLEAFAVKHRLMKDPYIDMGIMTPPHEAWQDHIDQGERATFPPYDC